MALNQTYQTGTLTYTGGNAVPYGSGGLLDTLRTAMIGTTVDDEVIDSTPNGILTNFTGTLANTPCGLGRLVVTYTVGASAYTASDNGSGVIADDASGHLTGTCTINYTTGAWELNFSTAPDNATDITADYIYGNPGADWKELMYQNTENKDESDAGFGGDCKEWIIHNTGKTGQENVIIGMREWWYSAGSGGGLNINVYTAWPTPAPTDWNFNEISNGLDGYNTTWKTWKEHPTLPLPYRSTVTYWMFSNRHRLALVVKIGGQYESMYLGFGRRYGAPADYPHPLIAKAGHHHNDAVFNNYADTGDSWRLYIAQHYQHADDGYPLMIVTPGDAYESGTDTAGLTLIPRDKYGTSDGTMGLTPYHHRALMTPVYVGHETTSAVYMDMDGVYHVAASGVSTEEELHANQKMHVLFQNVHRTNHYDFMAIEKEDHTTTTTSTTSSTTSSTSSTTTAP